MDSKAILVLLVVSLALLAGCAQQPQGKNETAVVKNITKEIPVPQPPAAPPAAQAFCNDSDSKDIYVQGTVESSGGSFSDTCSSDGKQIVEYSCNGSQVEKGTVICPDGYVCKIGACAKLAPEPAAPEACVDSDGKDFYVKGNVTTASGAAYVDNCATNDNARDYYCENNTVKSALKACGLDEGCYGGKCMKNPTQCSDSDGGIDIKARGIANYTDSFLKTMFYEDSCAGRYSLREYYCGGGNLNESVILCPDGKECFNGVCE